MMQKLYFGGPILTMEDAFPSAEAVLTEDGRILAVGEREELKLQAGPACQKIDLDGRTMLPAFLDPHSHFSGFANSFLQVPLDEVVSFEEITEKIREFIEENQIPEGQWVLAKGYDHNNLAEKRPPHKEVLDTAAPNHPLLLQHQSGHTGVFNSAALRLLGITAQTPSPAGGKIEVKNGELTGYVEENALIQYQDKIPMPSPEKLMGAYQKAQDKYMSYGITTIQEGMMVKQLGPLYETLFRSHLLRLDVVGYLDIAESDSLFAEFPGHIRQYQDRFKIGGYKIFLDGSPQSRTAWMLHPYQNAADGYCGYPTLTDEEIESRIRKALTDNMQLLAHCNGDAASLQYITTYDKVKKELPGSPDIRPVIIHAQLLPEDQLDLAVKNRMIASFFAAHVYHWGDVHIENFGLERAKQISLAASAKKAGLPFTFHQDSPVIQPDMMETVWCAVNRITKKGVLLGEEQKIPVWDALKAVTQQAAYQYFEEEEKGSIRPGKQANFAVLDRNPLAVEPMDLRNIRVLETIRQDETIFRR